MEYTIAHDFLEMAQNDLSAARLLYEHKYYSNAIFALQQSIEKAMKAVGMSVGIVDYQAYRAQPYLVLCRRGAFGRSLP